MDYQDYHITEIIENKLYQHLSPKDIYNLYYSKVFNFDFEKIFDKCLRYHLDNRLKNIFGKFYNKFIKIFLNDRDIFISGSFILQCILGEFYDSDIDIYYIPNENKTHKYNNRLYTLLIEMIFDDNSIDNFNDYKQKMELDPGSSKEKNIINIINNYDVRALLNKKINTRRDLYSSDLMGITITDYYIGKTKIQTLGLTSDDMISHFEESEKIFSGSLPHNCQQIIKYVIEEFDFEFCKNVYYMDFDKPNFYIHNLKSIIDKSDDLSKKNIVTSFWRTMKYRNRGFNIEGIPKDEILLKKIKKKFCQFSKYTRLYVHNNSNESTFYEIFGNREFRKLKNNTGIYLMVPESIFRIDDFNPENVYIWYAENIISQIKDFRDCNINTYKFVKI